MKTEDFKLVRYDESRASLVLGWVSSPEEARRWCGLTGEGLPSVDHLREWHRDPDVLPYLMGSKGTPLAYGEIWVDSEEEEIELARLIVDPQHRGQGIGRRLIEKLMNVAANDRYEFAYVRVVPDNEGAVACYQHAGFVRVSTDDEARFNLGQPAPYIWMRCSFTKDGDDHA